MKGTRWRKILKKLINKYYGEIGVDIVLLIIKFSSHSKLNEKLYRRKNPIQIPLNQILFDRITFSNMQCMCRQRFIPTFFNKDMIIIKDAWDSKLKGTKELWIPCIKCNEHTPIDSDNYNIEYDGVVIFHLNIRDFTGHDKYTLKQTIQLKIVII